MPGVDHLLRFVVAADDGCWVWTGAMSHQGYGRPWNRETGRREFAHRMFYEAMRARVPDGMQLDHLCRNRACVNPSHLEAVTQQENIRRSEGVQVLNSRKTHCVSGHALDQQNTYVTPDGRRNCRTCRYEATRRYQQRKKVA